MINSLYYGTCPQRFPSRRALARRRNKSPKSKQAKGKRKNNLEMKCRKHLVTQQGTSRDAKFLFTSSWCQNCPGTGEFWTPSMVLQQKNHQRQQWLIQYRLKRGQVPSTLVPKAWELFEQLLGMSPRPLRIQTRGPSGLLCCIRDNFSAHDTPNPKQNSHDTSCNSLP